MTREQQIAMYKNALSNYEPTIANLKSQLMDSEINEARKKDVENQIKNAEIEVNKIKENLAKLENKESEKIMLLPANKPKDKDITPKVFFIWGQSMSGKTYLARQFPNPLIINTDGNAKKVDTPSVEVYDFETFVKVLEEIEAGKHEFKTIIIDLVDDIKTMLQNYVCKKYGVDDEGEVPYGKGYREVKMVWQKLMVRLNQLPYNVIFISHVVEINEDNQTIEKPSLEQKYYNMCMGRCDMSIKCRKVGQTYLQLCDSKRDNYNEADVKDKDVLEILKGVKGVFPVKSPAISGQNDTKAKAPLKAVPLKKAEATGVMGLLDFIFGIITLLVGAFVVIGIVCTIWDTRKLEDENAKLRNDLVKARERKAKREYKKVSNVGGNK